MPGASAGAAAAALPTGVCNCPLAVSGAFFPGRPAAAAGVSAPFALPFAFSPAAALSGAAGPADAALALPAALSSAALMALAAAVPVAAVPVRRLAEGAPVPAAPVAAPPLTKEGVGVLRGRKVLVTEVVRPAPVDWGPGLGLGAGRCGARSAAVAPRGGSCGTRQAPGPTCKWYGYDWKRD